MVKDVVKMIIFSVPFLLWNCTASLPVKGVPKSGTYQKKLATKIMGASRSYLLHVPTNFNPKEKVPLVVVIHGAFSTPKQMEEESGFSHIADRENILVAYPAGAYGLFGFFQHWNAGHCCGKAANDHIDDGGFLESVIEDIRHHFMVDDTRIYMVGFSNGGMLTYRFAAERTHLLAAAAPMAASLGGKASSDAPLWITPKPKGPLPLIIFHARDDPSVPYEGGRSRGKGGDRTYVSVAESVDLWVQNNRCTPEPKVEMLLNGRVRKSTWFDPLGRNDIILYTIEDWGHKWPGKFFSDRLGKSDPLQGFNAGDLIWDFFKKYSRSQINNP